MNFRLRFSTLFVLIFWLIFWEFLVRAGFIAGAMLPRPSLVLAIMLDREFIKNYILDGVLASFAWAGLAWGAGLVCTLLMVTVVYRWKIAREPFDLLFLVGRTLPSVIAMPIFAAAIGIGRGSSLVCASFLAISYSVPSFGESYYSFGRARTTVREALGLTGMSEFLLVSLPAVGSAFRAVAVQAFGIALVVTVAGEMIFSLSGTAGQRVSELSLLLRMREVYALVGWMILGSVALMVIAESLPGLFLLPSTWKVRRILEKLS
jgi:ABC-type nitrate/sulfonate/bicarbonate transport system permease component